MASEIDFLARFKVVEFARACNRDALVHPVALHETLRDLPLHSVANEGAVLLRARQTNNHNHMHLKDNDLNTTNEPEAQPPEAHQPETQQQPETAEAVRAEMATESTTMLIVCVGCMPNDNYMYGKSPP